MFFKRPGTIVALSSVESASRYLAVFTNNLAPILQKLVFIELEIRGVRLKSCSVHCLTPVREMRQDVVL
jgi:hypothetical protein